MMRNNLKYLTIEDYTKKVEEQRGIDRHDFYDDDYDVGLSVGIVNARRAHGWTQKDLASALNMKQPNIARFETASSLPSHAMIKKMARVFGLRPTPPGFEQTQDSLIVIRLPLFKDKLIKTDAVAQSQETLNSSFILAGV